MFLSAKGKLVECKKGIEISPSGWKPSEFSGENDHFEIKFCENRSVLEIISSTEWLSYLR